MLTYNIHTPSNDRTIISTSGIMSLTEYLDRTEYNFYSKAKLNLSGITASGVISTLSLYLQKADQHAYSLITYTKLPSGLDTLTIDSRKYTFLPAGSGYTAVDQIKIGSNILENSRNIYRVINASGIAGTDFYTGQTAHSTVEILFPDNPLYLRARTSGTVGNTISISTTSASFFLPGIKFSGGTASESTYTMSQDITISSLSGIYYSNPLQYSEYGTKYQGQAYLTNSSGIIATTSGGVNVTWPIGPLNFYGRSSLSEFAEVTNLSGIHGLSDSSGIVTLRWDNMNKIYGPVTLGLSSGSGTQDTRSYSHIELGQNIQYHIFVYQGATQAPQKAWPRTSDLNGTWYYAGRTKYNSVNIQTPKTGVIGIWVGFGNKHTLQTTTAPISSISSLAYIIN